MLDHLKDVLNSKTCRDATINWCANLNNIVAAFVYPLFINVVQVRTSVYGRISAGFAFKNIFEMIKHDMGGLFRIFGMGIVLGIVTSIIIESISENNI